jgi:hypothetical protein
MLSFTDVPLPPDRPKIETYSSSQKDVDQYKQQSAVRKSSWSEWDEVLDGISDFEKRRFELSFESAGYILKTVGSFHLAPLLAVLAWLLLSVVGQQIIERLLSLASQ